MKSHSKKKENLLKHLRLDSPRDRKRIELSNKQDQTENLIFQYESTKKLQK